MAPTATTLRTSLSVFALYLSACAAPDVTPQITAMQSVLKQTAEVTQPGLEAAAKAEQSAAESALIATGQPAVRLQGPCDPSLADQGGTLAECKIVSNADLTSGPVTATQVKQAFATLSGYLDAVAVLASAKTSAEINGQAASIFDALGRLQAGQGSAQLRSAAAGLASARGPATTLIGVLIEQARKLISEL